MRYTVTTFKVRLEVSEMLGIHGARVVRFWEGRTK